MADGLGGHHGALVHQTVSNINNAHATVVIMEHLFLRLSAKDEDEDIWQILSDIEQRCITCTLHAHKALKKLIGQNRGVIGVLK